MIIQLLVVSCASRRHLVRLDDVQEIVPMMALAPLQGLSGNCRGMANLRGSLVPVFDSTGPDAPLSPSRFILVLRSTTGMVGIIVDEVHEVIGLPEEELVQRPVGMGRLRKMALLGEDAVSVLEPQEVLGVAQSV